MTESNRALRQILRLAYRDFLHEKHISFCFVIALLALLAPLLVLFGLKYGLVDTLAQRLIESPQYREIIGVGSGNFDAAWFETMAANPAVAFIIPNTRRISASFSELRNKTNDQRLSAVPMLPTATGDPLFEGFSVDVISWPMRPERVILSAQAAQKLDAKLGDLLDAYVDRKREDRIESEKLVLEVVKIASSAVLPGDSVVVPLGLLEATEDYRDGYAVPNFSWPGEELNEPTRVYPRFRLYAKSIYHVTPLRDQLLAQGQEVHTQAAEIETMQSLDRNLSRVFWLVAAIGGIGFLLSLAVNLLANIERKRRQLSVLRLLGFSTRSIMLFPVVQAALTGILGACGAILVYFIMAVVLNALFSESLQSGEFICRLLSEHILAAVLITLFCAVAASSWAGYRASAIEPSDGLRDV